MPAQHSDAVLPFFPSRLRVASQAVGESRSVDFFARQSPEETVLRSTFQRLKVLLLRHRVHRPELKIELALSDDLQPAGAACLPISFRRFRRRRHVRAEYDVSDGLENAAHERSGM